MVFARAFPSCGRRRWPPPGRQDLPGTREAPTVQACSRRLLAVTAICLLGLLAPGNPAAALELSEDPAWWRGNTLLLGPPGPAPVTAPALPDGEEIGASEKGGTWGFRKGQQEVGFLVGYGFEIDGDGSDKSEDIKNLEFAQVRPRWGIFLTDPVGQGFLRGNLELLLEPAFLLSFGPTRRTGFELSVLFRYHFATGIRWVPFLTAGAGIIEENFEVPGRPSAGFNFTPQGGPGLSYLFGGNMAMSLEWRLTHVSNANTDLPNVGLNMSFFLLGFSVFF